MAKTRNQLKKGSQIGRNVHSNVISEPNHLNQSRNRNQSNEKNQKTIVTPISQRLNSQQKEESKNTIVNPNQIKCMWFRKY